MQPVIKPIETVYSGYRFRSRLEARWAVFFNAMGFPYEYEKEGYSLDELGLYLPDFWLPQVSMWAEVKPEEMSVRERAKCLRLAQITGFPCLMLIGVPQLKPYWAMEPQNYGDDGPAMRDYALSNHHGYPQDEHRFFASIGFDETDPIWNGCFGDMEIGVTAARQARFEHGEHGR